MVESLILIVGLSLAVDPELRRTATMTKRVGMCRVKPNCNPLDSADPRTTLGQSDRTRAAVRMAKQSRHDCLSLKGDRHLERNFQGALDADRKTDLTTK